MFLLNDMPTENYWLQKLMDLAARIWYTVFRVFKWLCMKDKINWPGNTLVRGLKRSMTAINIFMTIRLDPIMFQIQPSAHEWRRQESVS